MLGTEGSARSSSHICSRRPKTLRNPHESSGLMASTRSPILAPPIPAGVEVGVVDSAGCDCHGTFVPVSGTNVPKGEARREAILRATLAVIGEHGADAVTHRAVAAAAGLPLSATTYWFSSRDELLEESLRLAAREEVERLERLVVNLAPREISIAEWAEAVAAELAGDLARDRGRHVAL